jgi:hypothetical protein
LGGGETKTCTITNTFNSVSTCTSASQCPSGQGCVNGVCGACTATGSTSQCEGSTAGPYCFNGACGPQVSSIYIWSTNATIFLAN